MSEVMLGVSNNNPDDHFDQTSRKTVDELRTTLDKKGLDVDGSKEVLVSRLKESNKGREPSKN